MIKFFRKIRQRMIKENRVSKYMLYAIGEIVLVVIGILIALQINSTYETSKTRQRESVLLNALHLEFLENQVQLERIVSKHEVSLAACNRIIAQFPIDLSTVDLDSLSKDIFNITWRYTFNPSQGTINSLINTSSFETITDDTLRALVISWQDVVNDYMEDEEVAKKILIEFIEPYLSRHFPFDIDLNNPKSDTRAITTLEFEHIIERRRESLTDIFGIDGTDELGTVRNTIQEIIERTKEPEQ